jgi:hypothetical protein
MRLSKWFKLLWTSCRWRPKGCWRRLFGHYVVEGSRLFLISSGEFFVGALCVFYLFNQVFQVLSMLTDVMLKTNELWIRWYSVCFDVLVAEREPEGLQQCILAFLPYPCSGNLTKR